MIRKWECETQHTHTQKKEKWKGKFFLFVEIFKLPASKQNSTNTSIRNELNDPVNLRPAILLLCPTYLCHNGGVFVTDKNFLYITVYHLRWMQTQVFPTWNVMYLHKKIYVCAKSTWRETMENELNRPFALAFILPFAGAFLFSVFLSPSLTFVCTVHHSFGGVYFMSSLMLPLSSTTYHVYYLFESKLYVHCLLMYLKLYP